MAEDYQPSSLAEVSSVDILVLGSRFSSIDDDMRPRFITIGREGFPILKCLKVLGDNSLAIAELWRKLPIGNDQDRCHNPPFGLRFYQAEEEILSASICWECSNIWIKEGETRYGYIFNPEHEVSQDLLKLLKKNLSES